MKYKLVSAHFPQNGKDFIMTVLFEENKPVEIDLTPSGSEQLLGNVYVGKIEEIRKDTGAAFVRISDKITGYLPWREGLKAGMELPVQVEKDAMKMKLPRLSENIRLLGRYFIMSSSDRRIYYSRKAAPEEKKRLSECLTHIRCSVPEDFGVIVRTEASGKSEDVLKTEYDSLARQMREILDHAETRTSGSCLYRGMAEWTRFYRYEDPDDFIRVVTDEPRVLEDLEREYSISSQHDDHGNRPALYTDAMLPLYKLYKFSTVLSEALTEKVYLPSGGFLIIQQTEAFVCVDVNSGRYRGKKANKEAVDLVNREAAEEISRQMRLRELSGTILIDFINMKTKESREDLIAYMKKCAGRDHSSVTVVDLTPLDIMEITREKRRRPLTEQIH
ncbi:MAG: ribonuclease E/G [Eubacteriales bacterium]|jgi:ribonuclease G